jgi:thiamine-monophosphate kinase
MALVDAIRYLSFHVPKPTPSGPFFFVMAIFGQKNLAPKRLFMLRLRGAHRGKGKCLPVMNFKLLENTFLQQISSQFRRSSIQINRLLESDAELLRLPDGSVLAVTIDCIAEEIATGLYSDPAHIGWMTVIVNLSDLAAVGAIPLGLLLSESLPPDFSEEKLQALQGGIAAACAATGVFVLGGDTNDSKERQMGATAVGLIPKGEPIIMRKGASAGDVLYCSGPMGLGSAYAFSVLLDGGRQDISFSPIPRLKEGVLVRQFGSCCIDTSDGFFHGLSNLLEVNPVGFKLDIPLSTMTHPAALGFSQVKQMPVWIFLAGPHGEFELLFTIPAKNEKGFLEEAEKMNWKPLRIGVCTASEGCTARIGDGEYLSLDPLKIANTYTGSGGDPQKFLSQLLALEASWEIQKRSE